MIDFHCHLDLYPDPQAVITESAKQGIYILAVTTTPKAFEGNLRLVGNSKRIRVAVGLHPELVRDRHQEVELVCQLMRRTSYIGEVGLDGSPMHRESLPTQRAVLQRILSECTRQGGKIISLHSRMAAQAVLDEISLAGNVGEPVLHWFTGNEKELSRAISLGCWFSVGPAMLKNAKGQKLVSLMPPDRILPETDGPLTQSGGKPLSPWDVDLVTRALADLWGMAITDADAQITGNFKEITSSPRVARNFKDRA